MNSTSRRVSIARRGGLAGPRRGLAAIIAFLFLGMAGCRKVPPLTTDHDPGASFWEIPREALGQQWLFRSKVRVEDDSVRLRIALRIAGPEDFELEALDRLGRRQWSMRVEQDEVLWLNHREGTACHLVDSTALPDSLPIPIPPDSLAKVLLDRAPREPSSPIMVDGDRRIYEDEIGERWVVVVDGQGRVESWSGGDPDGRAMSWARESDERVLSVEAVDVQIRWKTVLREALRAMLVPLAVPEGYREVDCTRDR